MLYAFAFGLQLILLVFRLSRVTRAHHSRKEITLWVVDMFVRAAPPSIPTIFLVLTHIARRRLDRAGLSLLFSKALRTGANINMVCFDKTGTLTDSVVRCVLAVDLPCFWGTPLGLVQAPSWTAVQQAFVCSESYVEQYKLAQDRQA